MVEAVSASNIKVSEKAFGYLKAQKGKLEPLARDLPRWISAYQASLDADYAGMKPYLPNLIDGEVGQVLDVGSGLGGIDILLHRHYGGHIVPVLLDGWNDKPIMTLHRKTFNCMEVAENFHQQNGVIPIVGVDANAKPLLPLSYKCFLVISLGSWCFHYGPEMYLDYVLDNSLPGATIITDVRKDKAEWRAALEKRLTLKAVVHGAEKFDRCVYARSK